MMTIKKMLLLAGMALAALAFTVPATASAVDVWTVDGETLGPGEEATQAFEGFFGFTTPIPIVPVHTTFGCEITITINAVGQSGGTVEVFNKTTETCKGTGVFGGCTVKSHSSNPPWAIDISTTPATVTGPITVHNVYDKAEGNCPIATTHLVFNSLSVMPISSEGSVTELVISGLATNGSVALSGSFTAEDLPDEPALGIEEL